MGIIKIERGGCIFNPLFYLVVLLSIISCSSVYDELSDNMVSIPSGEFEMGSESHDADPDESPVLLVRVESFRLCRFEVSQRLWRAVMGHNPSYRRDSYSPVEMVSYYDVERFIEILNKRTGKSYRLPTEIEWEYAANRGQSEQGSYIGDIAWMEPNSDGRSHHIGEKLPDALGLYDMVGNVNEWVYGSYDGKNYSGDVVFPCDSLVEEAVFRGGGFNSAIKFSRISNRNHAPKFVRNYAIGVRLAE